MQGELVSNGCYSQEQGTCSLSGGGGREVSTQLGCPFAHAHLRNPREITREIRVKKAGNQLEITAKAGNQLKIT